MIDVVIVPQGAEYKAVIRGLNKLKIKQPTVIQIPIGVKQIEATLTAQNFWQIEPKKVLMMGLCGSLSTRYSVGDTVLYQACYEQNKIKEFKPKITIDPELNRVISNHINCKKLDYSLSLVDGVTSDRIITSIADKQQLAERFNATVVDMESFAYLKLLQEKTITVNIIRVVSDDLKYDLPDLTNTIGDRGEIKPVSMTMAMAKKPLASLRFIRGSLQGLKKLQQVTIDLFGGLNLV